MKNGSLSQVVTKASNNCYVTVIWDTVHASSKEFFDIQDNTFCSSCLDWFWQSQSCSLSSTPPNLTSLNVPSMLMQPCFHYEVFWLPTHSGLQIMTSDWLTTSLTSHLSVYAAVNISYIVCESALLKVTF